MRVMKTMMAIAGVCAAMLAMTGMMRRRQKGMQKRGTKMGMRKNGMGMGMRQRGGRSGR